jgi:hypothetical protein
MRVAKLITILFIALIVGFGFYGFKLTKKTNEEATAIQLIWQNDWSMQAPAPKKPSTLIDTGGSPRFLISQYSYGERQLDTIKSEGAFKPIDGANETLSDMFVNFKQEATNTYPNQESAIEGIWDDVALSTLESSDYYYIRIKPNEVYLYAIVKIKEKKMYTLERRA